MSLPNGRIGYRKQQPRWNYDDETLLKYLERTELDELIRVSKAPNKAERRKQFEVVGDKVINTETGEVVEGIDSVYRDEVYTAREEGNEKRRVNRRNKPSNDKISKRS